MRASKSFFATGFVRSQETARPLIKKLGLKTVTEYSDTAGLVEKLRAMSDQTVLVVAHSDTLPTIIKERRTPWRSEARDMGISRTKTLVLWL